MSVAEQSERASKYGDQCPACKVGTLGVVKSEVFGRYRHRYLGCRNCGYKPDDNKKIVPIEFAPKRTIRD